VRFPEAFKHKVAQGHAAFAGTCGFFSNVQIKTRRAAFTVLLHNVQSQAGVRPLHDREFELLAKALNSVRRKVPFALCGYRHPHAHQDRGVSAKGLVDWKWSSAAWYSNRTGPIEIDGVRLSLNPIDRV